MQSAEKKNIFACLAVEDPMNGLLNPDDYEKGEESPARWLFPKMTGTFHPPTHDFFAEHTA